MSSVTVVIVSESKEFPAGTTSSGIKVTVGSTAQVLTSAPYVATFEDVHAGTWDVTAAAVDANGAVLGDVITGTVTIEEPTPAPVEEPTATANTTTAATPAPTVTIDAPTSLTITVH